MRNRTSHLLSITILLSVILAVVPGAGVRGSGYAQPPQGRSATTAAAELPRAAIGPLPTLDTSDPADGFSGSLTVLGGSAVQPQPILASQVPSEGAGQLTTPSNGTWRTYTNANTAEDLAVEGETVWAATSGGVVHWNRADGSYVKYTAPDGLANNEVHAIAIDDVGHKWFGTRRGGVSRFDGTTWTTYTANDGLADNSVWAIAIDHAGHKWFGTWRGVSRFDGTTWTTYTEDDGLAHNRVNAIAIDHAGHKWFGTSRGVSRFDGTTWTTYTEDDGLASSSVNAIAIDHAGHKWFGTSDFWGGGGVSRFDGTTWTTYTTDDGLADNYVWAIAIDHAGHKWFGTWGVSRFDGATWTTYTTDDGLAHNDVRAIAIDHAGHKWFGTWGVSRFDGATWTTYTTDDSLASHFVCAIAIDRAGHKWFATHGGVSVFDDTTWTTYTTEDGLPSNSVDAIAIDHAGHKWFGTWGDGVSVFDGTSWTTYTTDDGLAHNNVRAIAIDDAGDKWFGTPRGVSRFDGTTWTTYTEDDGLASSIVNAIAIDHAGHKWFGTWRGVSRFDGTSWTTYTTGDGLADNYVRAIAIDHAGHKWFGTQRGASRFDGTSWTTYTTGDGLADNSVWAIAIDHAGHKWFGTEGGVSVFDTEGTQTYTISGHVHDGEGDAIEGVVMSSFWFSPVETDENGYYEITGLEAGTYGYRPSKGGYVFEPDFVTVTVPPDATGQDFIAEESEEDDPPTDRGFRPDQHGYSFRNRSIESSDWDLFRATFGAENVERTVDGAVERRLDAERYYNDHYEGTGTRGNCSGMAASSMLVRRSWAEPEDFLEQHDVTELISLDEPNLDGRFWERSDIVDFIVRYQGYQLGQQVRAARSDAQGASLGEILDTLMAAMDGGLVEPQYLAIRGRRADDTTCGHHALMPFTYTIEGPETHVYVYDPNHPSVGDEQYISITQEGWLYDNNNRLGVWETDQTCISNEMFVLSNLTVIPLSAWAESPEPPWDVAGGAGPQLSGGGMGWYEFIVEDGASLSIEDELGQVLGNRNGQLTEEIPGSYVWMPEAVVPDITHDHPLRYVVRSTGALTASMVYNKPNQVSLHSVTPGGLVEVVGVSAQTGVTDSVQILPDASSVAVRAGSEGSGRALTIVREGTNLGREITIDSFGLSAGHQARLDVGHGGSVLAFSSQQDQSGYGIRLKQVGPASTVFVATGPPMGGNDRHSLYLDWNDPTTATVEIDVGGDGTVDEIVVIENEASLHRVYVPLVLRDH